MSKENDIRQFEHQGGVRSSTPFHKDIPHQTIRAYHPAVQGSWDQKLVAVQENPNDPESWYGKYIIQGTSWPGTVKQVLEALRFEYKPEWKCLVAINLGQAETKLGAPDGWEIEEFLLGKLISGNLVASITWSQTPNPGGSPTDRYAGMDYSYRTAYTWPGC